MAAVGQGQTAEKPSKEQEAARPAKDASAKKRKLEDLAAQGLCEKAAEILTQPLSHYPKTSKGTAALKVDMRAALREQATAEGRKKNVSHHHLSSGAASEA